MSRTCRTDEVLAVFAYIHIIYIARVARREHHLHVVGTATNDGALAEVLLDGGHQLLQVVLVVAAEVEVVISDGAALGSTLQQLHNKGTHAETCRIVGAEEHHVASRHFGQRPTGSHTQRLLVEGIGSIAVLLEESQADGTLLALPQLEMLRAYTIGLHELHRLPPHNVRTCIADEGTRHTCPPHADNAVEAAAAMHCRHWLPVAKEDVEYRLAYPDDLPCVSHCL